MKFFVELCLIFVLFYRPEIYAMPQEKGILLPKMSRTVERAALCRENLFQRIDIAMARKDNRAATILAEAASRYRFRGWSPDEKAKLLFYAVKNDLGEVVEYCADNRFHLDITDKEGKTPLIIAVEQNNCENVEYLLISGANPNVTDLCAAPSNLESFDDMDLCTGLSALMVASKKGNKRIVRMLINARANVNAVSNQGYTALDFAVEYNHPHIVQMLVKAGAKVNGHTPTSMDLYYYQKAVENYRKEDNVKAIIEILKRTTEPRAIRTEKKPFNKTSVVTSVRSFFGHE